MANENNSMEETKQFTPDFGNTFDDYGEYREPVAEAPARQTKRKRHVKRFRFPRLIWAALFVAVAVGLGILAAKYGWMWADDVLGLTRPDQEVEIVINENDDYDDVVQTLKDAGVIEYEWLFRLYCKLRGSEDFYDPGVYTVNLNYDYHALVNRLNAKFLKAI